MNPNELKSLLKAVAVSDKRTTGTDDLDYWARMAQEGRWTFATAMRALIIFRDAYPDKWLNPGHITEIIRDARRKAAETFVVPKEPDDITGADLPRWHRAQLAAHQDRLLAAWCGGEPMPTTPAAAAQLTGGPGQITSGLNFEGCPDELKEPISQAIARMGSDRPINPPIPVPRLSAGDPEQRAQARAELATTPSLEERRAVFLSHGGDLKLWDALMATNEVR